MLLLEYIFLCQPVCFTSLYWKLETIILAEEGQ